MKTKPVKRYATPGYPARLQVLTHPALLRQNVPPTWHVPELAALVMFLSANTPLCRGADRTPAATIVAPIFEHGEGRGSIGCIVVAPPAFLSEEEALQAIQEELAAGGVKLTERQRVLQAVNTPLAEQVEGTNGMITLQPRGAASKRSLLGFLRDKKAPFKVDAVDPKKHIAVEFVSAEEFTQLCGHSTVTPEGSFSMSSVLTYRVKDLAGFVAERVKKESKEKVYFGAFYDPSPHVVPTNSPPATDPKVWRKRYEDATVAAQAESKRLLRLQVQDFVKWLQAQGAI